MKKQVKKKDPRQHILDVSSCLIARKGFAAVGVREIASKAGVNISMISYYFGGKVGILKAINEVYFKKINEILGTINEGEKSPEVFFKRYIKELVEFFIAKKDYCRVAILEMPLEHKEITEFKVEMLKGHRKFIKENLRANFDILDRQQQGIIGPAFISLVFSNFLLGELIQKISNIKFDDSFYKKYADTISNLFLYGVHGIAKENKKSLK
jgi:AcrR family transcriptional regulator